MWNNKKVDCPRHLKSVRDYVMHCCLVRTLRQQPPFLQSSSGFIVVVLPSDFESGHFKRSVSDILYGASRHANHDDANSFDILTKTPQARSVREFIDDFQQTKKLIALADSRDSIPPLIELAADAVLDLSPVTIRDLRAACRVVAKIKVSEAQAASILSYPLEQVWPCIRPGRSAEDILQRLALAPASSVTRQRQSEVPRLSEMHGYGPAKAWGLELAQDLTDWQAGRIVWDDVDKGIILSGPPGVGKTIFARALAKECGVELVATSLGRWQATGHLGDLLKAMRSDFARAKSNAPSVLFIDELDSVGDRTKFSDDHKSYSVQVVNAFLECLDGLDSREGVIVVGATNHVQDIDAAVLRPGRLDKHIEIPLPNADDRIQILHQQLNGTIDAQTLDTLRQRTDHMSGADLAKAVRDARRIARRAKRPVTISDLEAALPSVLHLDADHVRANAIHEAAHTVVGLRLGGGTFVATILAKTVIAGSPINVGGHASFSLPVIGRRDRSFYLDQIAISLAGIAAEDVVFGKFGDGAGIADTSDLAHATRLATVMCAQLGMAGRLRFSQAATDQKLEALRRSDPALNEEVDKILQEQFERARALIEADLPLVERFAEELIATGSLTPERATEIEAKLQFQGRLNALRAG